MSGDGDPAAALGLNLDELPGAGMILPAAGPIMTGPPVENWLGVALASGQPLGDLAAGVVAMANAMAEARRLELPTVYQAVASVKRRMAGVGRTREAPEKAGGFLYRGIDDITAAVRVLEAEAGVVIAPLIEVVERQPLTGNWSDTFVRVTWSITGPRGDLLLIPHPTEPGKMIPPQTEGWGRDNADKGTNKAITQAYKQLLLILYTVGDDAHDPDGADVSDAVGATSGRRHQGQAQPVDAAARAYLDADTMKRLRSRALALPPAQREAFRAEWLQEDPTNGDTLPTEEVGGKTVLGFRLLFVDQVPGVEAMLVRHERQAREAERARTGEAATPATQPGAGPAAPAEGDRAGDPAEGHTVAAEDAAEAAAAVAADVATARDAVQSFDEGARRVWKTLIEGVHAVPAGELLARIRAAGGSDDPAVDGATYEEAVQQRRAHLASLEGQAAGLPPYEVVFAKPAEDDATEAAADAAFEAEADAAERAGDRNVNASE